MARRVTRQTADDAIMAEKNYIQRMRGLMQDERVRGVWGNIATMSSKTVLAALNEHKVSCSGSTLALQERLLRAELRNSPLNAILEIPWDEAVDEKGEGTPLTAMGLETEEETIPIHPRKPRGRQTAAVTSTIKPRKVNPVGSEEEGSVERVENVPREERGADDNFRDKDNAESDITDLNRTIAEPSRGEGRAEVHLVREGEKPPTGRGVENEGISASPATSTGPTTTPENIPYNSALIIPSKEQVRSVTPGMQGSTMPPEVGDPQLENTRAVAECVLEMIREQLKLNGRKPEASNLVDAGTQTDSADSDNADNFVPLQQVAEQGTNLPDAKTTPRSSKVMPKGNKGEGMGEERDGDVKEQTKKELSKKKKKKSKQQSSDEETSEDGDRECRRNRRQKKKDRKRRHRGGCDSSTSDSPSQSSSDSDSDKESACERSVWFDNRPFLEPELGGKKYQALYDTGAMTSMVGPEIVQRHEKRLIPTRKSMITATGGHVQLQGLLPIKLDVDGQVQRIEMRAVKELENEVILGMDFCKQWNIETRMGRNQWRVGSKGTWRQFAGTDNSEPLLYAECAGVSELSRAERKKVTELVERIQAKAKATVGVTHLTEHHIDVQGARPVKCRTRPMSRDKREAARAEVAKMLEEGIIEPSASAWCSAPVLVKKTDGTWRFCVDYSNVNKVSTKDAYPCNDMNATLDRLRGARYISKIDLAKAYWQVPMAKDSRKYTAFSVEGVGLFQFTRMPFGLTNAPATLMRLINELFGPVCQPHVFGYLDDLIIVTETFEEHLWWLDFVLEKLRAARLAVNMEKSEFCCSSVTYLGFILDADGLHPDPMKVAPVTSYPRPKNVKQLRRFLGMVGWYARFMAMDAEIKVPLFKLLKQSSRWEWETEQEEAFTKLKTALVEAPVLARPDFNKPFTIQVTPVDKRWERCLPKNTRMVSIQSFM